MRTRQLPIIFAAFWLASFALAGCQVQEETSGPAPGSDTHVALELVLPRSNKHLKSPSILVFSETLDWRHEEGIAAANLFFLKTGEALGYGVYTTENSAVFNPETLSKFDIVVFNNFTGDALTPEQEKAFETWFKAGGGWLGLHAAGDSSHQDWNWYSEVLLGSTFTAHPAGPQFQTARLQSLTPSHPVLNGLPESWEHHEEWYSFDVPAQNFGQIPLLGVDETTYSPKNLEYGNFQDLRMDKDGIGPLAHPVAWARCEAQGRAVYSALGHQASAYEVKYNQHLIKNILLWVNKKTDINGLGCKP